MSLQKKSLRFFIEDIVFFNISKTFALAYLLDISL